MLVYTPHGNLKAVGAYLSQGGLRLENPADPERFEHHSRLRHYINPHASATPQPVIQPHSRWSAPSVTGKTLEVQRSQVEELYKNIHNGDELPETAPGTSQLAVYADIMLSDDDSSSDIYTALSTSEESFVFPA